MIYIFVHNTVQLVNVTLSRPEFDSNIIVTMLSHKWTEPDHFQTYLAVANIFPELVKKQQ